MAGTEVRGGRGSASWSVPLEDFAVLSVLRQMGQAKS